MGYLTDLAGGLRAAAGVLNPDIQKQNAEDEQRNEVLRQQQAQLLVRQLAQNVANGVMTKEAAQAATSARGLNVPPEYFGDASVETRTKLAALEKDRLKQRVLASPQVQDMLSRGDVNGVESVLLGFGLADPLAVMKERRAAGRPLVVAPGARAVNPLTGEVVAEGGPKERPPIKIDRFPVDAGRVQPHISLDGGKTFQPVQGSVPINAKDVSGAATIINNPPGAMVPGKAAANKIDEGLLDTTQRIMQLSQIEKSFKPEWLEIGTRLGMEAANWKDKLGMSMDPKDTAKLTEYSEFRRNAIDNLNQYIKAITGAAMSEAEAKRILRGMPNPGQGLFDGDGPKAFKAKLDGVMKQAKLAEARLVYLKRNGMSLTDASGREIVPLERMPSLMNERAGQIERELRQKNPAWRLPDIQAATHRQLAQEFGLVQ